MFYFLQDEDNELYRITKEQYEKIKSETDPDFELSIVNPTTGKFEWIDPETGEWNEHHIADM